MTMEDYKSLSYEEKVHFNPEEYRRIVEADRVALREEQARTSSFRYLVPRFLKEMAPVFVPGLIVLGGLIALSWFH